MNKSVVVALKDSSSSMAVVDFLAKMPFYKDDYTITLLHVFRKPSASEELMGEEFVREEPTRLEQVLKKAQKKLIQNGYKPENVNISLVAEKYPTITEGIIDQIKKGGYFLVVIGRRQKSKSEEFVMGDISVKLVRGLDEVAVLVVKSK